MPGRGPTHRRSGNSQTGEGDDTSRSVATRTYQSPMTRTSCSMVPIITTICFSVQPLAHLISLLVSSTLTASNHRGFSMSEHERIWLIDNSLGLKLYVREDNLESVAHNYFLAGSDNLVMMELEGILDVGEEPRPIQTVTISNLMGFVEWMESTGRKPFQTKAPEKIDLSNPPRATLPFFSIGSEPEKKS